MANQFMDKVSEAYERGEKAVPGFDKVSRFYSELANNVNVRGNNIKVSEIKTENSKSDIER